MGAENWLAAPEGNSQHGEQPFGRKWNGKKCHNIRIGKGKGIYISTLCMATIWVRTILLEKIYASLKKIIIGEWHKSLPSASHQEIPAWPTNLHLHADSGRDWKGGSR
jgi:hypothetical protein